MLRGTVKNENFGQTEKHILIPGGGWGVTFWGFQKNKYFLVYEDFVDIFGGSSQNWTIFRGDFYVF